MSIKVFNYAYGGAANNPDCEDGPLVVQKLLEGQPFNEQLDWALTLQSQEAKHQLAALPIVLDLNTQLAEGSAQAVQNNQYFVTLGGDHSSAMGTWSGAATAKADEGSIGLLWVDAHMDSHTFETSDSGNIHGMPLATLLGEGNEELANILSPQKKVKPEHVAIVGIRSFQAGEKALLEKLGVRVFYIEEVKERGIDAVMKDALEIVNNGTVGFGITIDLDGFDPEDAPGVGCREPGGISAGDFKPCFKEVVEHPHFLGAEIVEYNPIRDKENMTAELVIELMQMLPKK